MESSFSVNSLSMLKTAPACCAAIRCFSENQRGVLLSLSRRGRVGAGDSSLSAALRFRLFPSAKLERSSGSRRPLVARLPCIPGLEGFVIPNWLGWRRRALLSEISRESLSLESRFFLLVMLLTNRSLSVLARARCSPAASFIRYA
jgi:hypothetical protein